MLRSTANWRGSGLQAMRDKEDTERPKGFDDFEVKLGDELRGERATRGKSLLDVQRDLRVKAAYIAAIESCDPSVFPNRGFVAGYVRSYARYLGLDPETMFRRFCEESGFRSINADLAQGRTTGGLSSSDTILKGEERTPRFGDLAMVPRESILSTVSPSGIASVLILALLVGGIGYGGWSVIQDIQRVEFAPVDQTPGAAAAAPELTAPELISGKDLDLAGVEPIPDRTDILSQLYRPQELEVPQVAPRDGPIAGIDPDKVGLFRPEPAPIIDTTVAVNEATRVEEFQGPVVAIDLTPPPVEVVAVRAAWVRVFEEDGTVLHEKILEAGERYQIPQEARNPMLRAGNSGSVFVVIDNQTYGPVGRGTSVAKRVSLSGEDVMTAYTTVEGIEIPPDPTVRAADAQQ